MQSRTSIRFVVTLSLLATLAVGPLAWHRFTSSVHAQGQARGGRTRFQAEEDRARQSLRDAWQTVIPATSEAPQAIQLSPDQQTQELKIDDGVGEAGVRQDGLIVVNRLTPTSYPAQLSKIKIAFAQFTNQPNPTGQQITLLFYADPTGAGQPPAGAQFTRFTATIPGIGLSTFYEFNVTDGPTLTAGDFYVGYQAGTPNNGVGFLADSNSTDAGRAFFSLDNGTTFNKLPVPTGAASFNPMIRAVALSGPAQPGNPITALTPATLVAGSKGTFRVTGTGFTTASKVLLGNRELPTTLVSATELQATYYADDFPTAGSYNVKVAGANNTESNTLPLTVTALPAIAEQEPNNNRTTADLLPVPGQRMGRAATGDAFEISYRYGDGSTDPLEDLYAFRLTQNAQVELTLTAAAAANAADLDLFLFRDTDTGTPATLRISINDSTGDGVTGERIRIALTPGRYLVGVSAYSGASDYTLTATIPNIAVVSAADYTDFKGVARQSIAALFGANLATQTVAAASTPLPTTLAGASIKVKDAAGTERDAPLFFVSPGQINFLVPDGLATGLATVTVTASNGAMSAEQIIIYQSAPALFTANNNGLGVPAALVLRVGANNVQSYESLARFDTATNRYVPVPIDLGPATDQIFLILYGTGLREAGAAQTRVFINDVSVPVAAVVAAPGFTGLDQINVGPLPRTLIGAGEVDLDIETGPANAGTPGNTVRVNIK